MTKIIHCHWENRFVLRKFYLKNIRIKEFGRKETNVVLIWKQLKLVNIIRFVWTANKETVVLG